MDVISLALDNDTFSYHGNIYEFPPPGIPDRGGFVESMTLIPRPLYPYEIWQAITSPPSLEAVPKRGYGGVFWLKHHLFIKQWWERYAELYAESHGTELAPGEKRMLVTSTCVEDTYEQAVESVRPGHDEFWKFLGPYGWSRGYADEDGKPVGAGLIPTLDDSLRNKTWLIGSPDDVAEGLAYYRDLLGGLENLVLFPNMPGDSYRKSEEQMERLANDVLPMV